MHVLFILLAICGRISLTFHAQKNGPDKIPRVVLSHHGRKFASSARCCCSRYSVSDFLGQAAGYLLLLDSFFSGHRFNNFTNANR